MSDRAGEAAPDRSAFGRLLREPQAFEFFRAIDLLRGVLDAEAASAGSDPGAPGHRTQDRIRFGADASLTFPSAQLSAIETSDPPAARDAGELPDPARRQYKLIVSFMGLLGSTGALPWHYTIDAIEGARDRERAMIDFLDLFQTRLVHLFYEARDKYQLAPRYAAARTSERGEHDPFTRCLLGLMGMGTGGQARRADVDEEALLRYAAFFADHRRNATSLGQMLGDYFGVAVAVEQFQFQWLDIPEPDRSRLGVPGELRRLNNQLSRDAVLGSRVLDCQSRFRVRLGPLGFADYLRFIADGADLPRAYHLIRLYVRGEFDFDVQPVLKHDEVPAWRLTSRTRDQPHRLGRTMWLKSVAMTQDFQQMAYAPADLGAA